jgi:hypothetical protein
MPQHIGIVACSAEGAALCYRTICVEGADLLGPHAHPEVSMHTPSLAEYVRCLEREDWQGVGELMLASAHKLARIGADFLICPDNTIHQALPLITRDRHCRGCTSQMLSPTMLWIVASGAWGCWVRGGWSQAGSIRRSLRHVA